MAISERLCLSELDRNSWMAGVFCLHCFGRARQGAGMYGHTEGKFALPVGPSVIANIICMGTGIKNFEKGIRSGIWWFCMGRPV